MSPQTGRYTTKQAEILRKHLYGGSKPQASSSHSDSKSDTHGSYSKTFSDQEYIKKDLFKTLLLSFIAIIFQIGLYFGILNGFLKI